jgi:hypothetical protein
MLKVCFCAKQVDGLTADCVTESEGMYRICNVPRAPAIKPKMRAFSARLTLFAFLNISWAASICSR